MNVADLLEFLACFGTMAGDVSFNPDFDFNGDGKISVIDLMQLLADFDPFNGGSLSGKTSGGK